MNGGRYRFIGEDGSLGYRTGRVYSLWVYPLWRPGEASTTRFGIERRGWQRWLHGPGYCPYTNQVNFYKNWEEA